MKKLILVRGLPGSGKSTYAREQAQHHGYTHVEADMYFENVNGGVFDPTLLRDAHAWCQHQVRYSLQYGTVIVSNTFTQRWEMQPYIAMAQALGIDVEIITMTGDYGSIHNVPQATIDKMRQRWEDV